MNGLKTPVDLNILPLESYDLLIGIVWLEKHRVILNFYDKTLSCLDDKGNTIVIKGIPTKVTIREISTLQMKRSIRKGCKVFAVYIMDDKDNKLNVEDIPILKDFKDIFPKYIPILPMKRYIDFTMDFVQGQCEHQNIPIK